MVDLDNALKGLTPQQQELLLRRLGRERAAPPRTATERIPRRPRTPGSALEIPLSSAQQRLWFLDRLAPGSPVYAIPAAIEVVGRLDAAALAASLGTIVRRHEALRTTFAAGPQGPVQVIHPVAAGTGLDVREADLRSLPAAERPAEAARRATAESRRPFDLERGPLMRALLLRLEDERHLCVLTVHHIVSDGWSMGILVRELAALYPELAAGRPSPLPPPCLQFADYALWEQERLQGETLERELDFWRERVAGAPMVLDLPTDRPRPVHQTFNGAQALLRLEPELVAALKETGAAAGATLFMTILAAWDVLLSRWTGQETLLVGSPIANRARAETQEIFGFLGNMLVLRGDLAGDPTLGELLGRVRKAAVAVFGHPEIPFARLVEELHPERDLGRSPLFQTVFIVQPAEAEALELPGLRIAPRDLDTGTAKFELTLQLAEGAAGVAGWIEYNTDLFDAATVERMAAELEILLRAFPGKTRALRHRRISGLPLLTAAEQAQLAAWNETARPFPAATLLHELVWEQAARTPDAPAVTFRGASLTYRELTEQAATFARRLRALGVGPEARVGLCVERTPAMVAALLGILAAGGAYVPLDPAHPAERLRMVLEDSGMAVLVTEEALLAGLPAVPAGIRVVCLEGLTPVPSPIAPPAAGRGAPPPDTREDAGETPALPGFPFPPLPGEGGAPPMEMPEGGQGGEAARLAYVIYTSGSTGRPKGVQVSHGAVVNFLRAMAERIAIDAGDVVPAITTLSFDIAGLEIYLPLAVGGRVEMVAKEEAADGGLLAARLREAGSTLVQATPATWRLLLGTGWQGILGLRALCGGEALPRDLARELAGRGIELWNVYGPTETAVWSTAGAVAPAGDDGPVPLGPPLANTELLVVDRHGSPVPVGAAGELLIGGRGVARGYLGRPELTAERFVPHPSSTAPGARLYCTGDLVRWHANNLEFLGRLDHQVKVRGFRIELGEIEAALVRHPAVAQAVVVAAGEGHDRRLVAYVVGEEGLDAEEMQDHLRRTLPEYMVPAAFVTLDAFPLTPTGKVDRKALPAPAREGGAEAESWVAPRTALEREIAALWGEVLGVASETIGSHDNFFQLGGNSISGAVFINRLQGRLGESVHVAVLFDAPTVARLAAHLAADHPQAVARIEAGETLPVGSAWVAIPRRAAGDEPLPLSFAQERLLVLHQLDPDSALYNLNGSVRLEGALDVALLVRCLSELVRRHEVLRTTFVAGDERPVQVVLPPAAVRLPVVDLAALPAALRDAETARLASEEDSRPFDVLHGALFRATLLRLAPDAHALLQTFHHICSDGWSIGIVVREVVALYRAFLAGEPSPLPEPPIQYGDFALWQRDTLQGEALEAELAWWKERLGGELPALHLPADRRRATVQGFQIASVARPVSPELARGAEELARRLAASPFMVWLAVWKSLLARLTGEEDVVVGGSTANRTRPEVEGLIGVFLNNVVLRTSLAGGPTFREALARVRETVLGAFAHQSMPLETIFQAVHPGAAAPPLQVMFLMMNLPQHTVEVPGLTFSALHAERVVGEMDTALVEVGFNVEETPEGLTASISYNGFLFDQATAAGFLDRTLRLLAGVVADPERPLWSYELMTAEERGQLLAWGAAPPAGDADLVHRLFEARAAASPDAPAVLSAGDAGGPGLTYGELDRRANQVAHLLRGLGVGPEVMVGIALERSPELIVALLGVLKAGGAYVPLDPATPGERLAFILEDAGATVLLTTSSVLAVHRQLGTGPARQLQTVLLDSDKLAALPVTRPRVEVDPGHLVYLIYTSGSTGRPKGVMVRHGSLAAYVAGFCAEHGVGPADRVLQFASVGFDTSAEEIYPALTSGAAVVLRDDTLLVSAPDFLRICGEQGITILDLPTAFWHETVARLADTTAGESPAAPPSLRLLILGGERALSERLEAWWGLGFERIRLVNTYGPTETTIVATRCALTPAYAAARGEVPIGRPVPGACARVADPFLELAPPGIAGELCVGGAGLARGYLDRPDLTAERFVPDPWAAAPGERFYRTGDLVRLLHAGETERADLEFVGRVDDQVKIRGFRVELREIEAVLGGHPEVAAAVVTAREDAPGDRRLAAYVVPRNGTEPDAAVLRAFVAASLPDYMVPAAYVVLPALPLTASGKVDRRALPAPDRSGAGDREHVAPETFAEETVAGIWRKVLGVDRVGATDNFFALGGHSLLLPQVMHQLRLAFQVEIPLRTLFTEPTVEGLALAVEEILLADIEQQIDAASSSK